ncbi:hypothetical protein K458DRAFT_414486 [Lentithecium fluviatile CBS 122367]|uniref:Nuclear GTPase SLIP-GC n=1 Tax=Lentithecium fluviatile CBS 122367 TaxID=1168545 RepID=A0A6G1JE14_9PLEO|nr:hypothetical protein K458DRAFT_414486 [Lentithecium fluviatile CBS 122367]
MDWDTLHAKASAAMPPGGIPPKRYMVGVLLSDKSVQRTLTEFDFIWMKAHAKIPVSTIKAQYMKRFPDSEIILQFRGEEPASDATLKLLNHHGDNLVVFQAMSNVSQGPLPPTSVDTVLQPVSGKEKAPARLPIKTESHRDAESAGATGPPLTPLSASNETKSPPSWDLLRDRERPSIEPAVRRLSHIAAGLEVGESASPQSEPPQSSQAPGIAASSADTLRSLPYHSPNPAQTLPIPAIPPRGVHTPTAFVEPEHRSPPPIVAKRYSASPSRSPEPYAPTFDPEDVFNREPSPEADDEVAMKPLDRAIKEIIAQQSPEILEAGVAKSMNVLEALKSTFARYKTTSVDANSWIQAINKLMTQAERTRTVVGVVGNTGAGKSSVINAMLDEERLVPTNCMRACTAVVTELSWNDSNEPNHKYRAEIEFIGRADWEKELKILLKEFLTENGTLSRESSDQNSDAGIAWAKFHAVYPKIHKDNLNQWTVEKLMAEKAVLNVLDTTKRINKPRPDGFYTELQKYVDSKEKVTGKKDKKDKEQKKPPASMEYWPLIKVVKIYTKSPALSTGAVIVDLPGVHDSNVARAAVADGYMKKCTGLWIVAPITRAVDDKAAKTLLGDSFKRQLKYDGGYSSVTFICSKTDDISITEATESLELNDEISDLEDQQRSYEKEIDGIKDKIAELKESIQVYRDVMDSADQDLDIWEDLKDRAEDGKRVFAPMQKKKSKRKRGRTSTKSRKRRQGRDDDSDIEYTSSRSETSGNSENDPDSEGIQPPRPPLTLNGIKRKLEELRSSKKSARQEKAAASSKISELKPRIQELSQRIADVQAKMSASCIAGRNEYSKGAIQNDFAAGIKELDQENLAEEDEESFNPDVEIRDYDEVARSLPVFCVSSRAYQKMCGRLKKDENVPGFKTLEETEMPQLQAHCRKLTEAGRIQTCRSFLLSLCAQLTTFQLWASYDGTGIKMTDEDKQKQFKYLQTRLRQLEEGLEKAVAACLNIMKKELRDQVFDRFPNLINEAVEAAPDTAQKWGAHRDAGGLYYSTYKAICRRSGAYQSSTAGHRDFNAELMDPILKRGATAWERTFQKRLPKALEVYTKDAGTVLKSFHEKIEERARQNGVGLANLSMLKGSIHNYEQMFQALSVELLAAMQEAQKDANRDFVPTIANIMYTAYELCTEERGPGSYMRMKAHMVGHVDRQRHTMFTFAAKTVEHQLTNMCKGLEEKMANKSDEIFAVMHADYMRVLGGVNVSQNVMSREEKGMRTEIKVILDEVDSQFQRISDGELDGEERVDDDVAAEEPEADKPLRFDNDDADSIVKSSCGSDNDETMQEVDDTMITEPSPTKGSDFDADASGAGDFQPTVSDDSDEEL